MNKLSPGKVWLKIWHSVGQIRLAKFDSHTVVAGIQIKIGEKSVEAV